MSPQEERERYPDRLSLISEVLGDSLCVACESYLKGRHFRTSPRGGSVLGPVLCWTCAKEVAYGIVPLGLPFQSFGGRAGFRPGARVPEDEDSNGCRSNAVRALEELE